MHGACYLIKDSSEEKRETEKNSQEIDCNADNLLIIGQKSDACVSTFMHFCILVCEPWHTYDIFLKEGHTKQKFYFWKKVVEDSLDSQHTKKPVLRRKKV